MVLSDIYACGCAGGGVCGGCGGKTGDNHFADAGLELVAYESAQRLLALAELD